MQDMYAQDHLAQTVSVVSRYMCKHRKEHRQAVKQIFRQLNGTIDIGLIYQGETTCALAGCSNSDYVADLNAT